jgi:hypothetical protein
MAGPVFHSIANPRALIPRTATTILSPWQSAFQCSADCQPPPSDLLQTLRAVQACGNPLSNLDTWVWQSAGRPFSMWQSADLTPRSANTGLTIWAQSLVIEWNPAPTILHREALWLNCHTFLTHDFSSVKLIRDAMSRPKLYVKCLSWHNISWYYTFKDLLLITKNYWYRPKVPRSLSDSVRSSVMLWIQWTFLSEPKLTFRNVQIYSRSTLSYIKWRVILLFS